MKTRHARHIITINHLSFTIKKLTTYEQHHADRRRATEAAARRHPDPCAGQGQVHPDLGHPLGRRQGRGRLRTRAELLQPLAEGQRADRRQAHPLLRLHHLHRPGRLRPLRRAGRPRPLLPATAQHRRRQERTGRQHLREPPDADRIRIPPTTPSSSTRRTASPSATTTAASP